MLIFAICLLVCHFVVAQGPVPLQPQQFNVLIDDKTRTGRADSKLFIPAGIVGDVTMTLSGNTNDTEFIVCLKQGVAPPLSAYTNSWSNPGYCELFSFKNGTKSFTMNYFSDSNQRRRTVKSHLMGYGEQNKDVAARREAKRAGVHSLSRRSTSDESGGMWTTQSKNIRAGHYFVTAASLKKELKANMTITLTVNANVCPDAGDSGPDCRPAQDIYFNQDLHTNGVPAQFYSYYRLVDYNKIKASTGAMHVSGNILSGDTNVTLYARWGALPTEDINDAKIHFDKSSDIMLTVPAPRSKPWFFALWNGNATNVAFVNMTVTFDDCQAGRYGAKCSIAPGNLGKAGVTTQSKDTKKGDKLYFKFHANDSSHDFFSMLKEQHPASLSVAAATAAPGADGKEVPPLMFARLGQVPTTTEFDVTGCTVESCENGQVTQIVPYEDVDQNLESEEWFVLLVAQDDVPLAVWNAAGGACASGCDLHGKCNKETATCVCAQDYSLFDCSQAPGLQRWEWALIIGGGVLVAIGLIGCIVYFIQKQQRRAGFERV